MLSLVGHGVMNLKPDSHTDRPWITPSSTESLIQMIQLSSFRSHGKKFVQASESFRKKSSNRCRFAHSRIDYLIKTRGLTLAG